MTTTDCAKAIHKANSSAVPVLFLDTCSLLDIMRDLTRPKFRADSALAAMYLLEMAEAQPAKLLLVIAKQVKQELKENQGKVGTQNKNVLKQLDETINRVAKIAEAYGVAKGTCPRIQLSDIGLHKTACEIVDRFVAASIIIEEDEKLPKKAWDRVRRGIRPSQKGKQSIKDCIIIETYLHFAREARKVGYEQKMLFLSSNTYDYAEALSSRLHSELETDFNSGGIRFATNFLAARYSIF